MFRSPEKASLRYQNIFFRWVTPPLHHHQTVKLPYLEENRYYKQYFLPKAKRFWVAEAPQLWRARAPRPSFFEGNPRGPNPWFWIEIIDSPAAVAFIFCWKLDALHWFLYGNYWYELNFLPKYNGFEPPTHSRINHRAYQYYTWCMIATSSRDEVGPSKTILK